MVADRKGTELKVGDKVKHLDRGTGTVVAIDPDRLPLVDVDCGKEFVSGIPHTDLEVVPLEQKLRCKYARKYKAHRAPTCGCKVCAAKWAMKSLIGIMVGRLHVVSTDEEVTKYVASRFKKSTPAYMVEACQELALVLHARNFKQYREVMG